MRFRAGPTSLQTEKFGSSTKSSRGKARLMDAVAGVGITRPGGQIPQKGEIGPIRAQPFPGRPLHPPANCKNPCTAGVSFIFGARKKVLAFKSTRLRRPLFAPFVFWCKNVHRIPPNVRDDGQRPSFGRDARSHRCDLPDRLSEIFLRAGLDTPATDLPVGQISKRRGPPFPPPHA